MKAKIILLILLFSFCGTLSHSQVVINNPRYGKTNAPNKIPYRIEITKYSLSISFHVTHSPGKTILITDSTFIQSENSNQKLYIISGTGIRVNEAKLFPYYGELEFKLVFPPLNVNAVNKFRYVEPFGRGYWFINDIEIR